MTRRRVPENDFEEVTPNKEVTIHLYATGKDVAGEDHAPRAGRRSEPRGRSTSRSISRIRSEIPVGTTGEILVEVGAPLSAVEIPLSAAKIEDTKASIFYVDGDTAHTKTFTTLAEGKGLLYAAPAYINPGTIIVTEGRSLLK